MLGYLKHNTNIYLVTLCSLCFGYYSFEEPGSSVSIVSDYGLDDRAIEVRSLAEAK
jgi:hypothetical protein